MSVLDKYEKAHSAFASGSVLTDDNEKLIEYLSGLSNQNNTNTGTQHRDLIRGITINHILLQRHIDALNKQNAKIQWWVIALAVAALISALVQTAIAIAIYLSPTPTAPAIAPVVIQSPLKEWSTVVPTQATPRSSHPAKEKKP